MAHRGNRGGRRQLDGFVLVDKPKGITSFDVIRRLRQILHFRKMGHMGTLDPNATGLLPICLGKATRLGRFLLKADKRYRATIRLGQSTDTYDADGQAVGEKQEPPEVSTEALDKLLARYRGTFMQRPPIYSAKKVDGKRLYELAREGKTVEPELCEVTIHQLDVLEHERDRLVLDIRGSTGMYVRSLAHDIGVEIGCGAYLEELQRLGVGALTVENAYTLERIEKMEADGDRSYLQPMDELLPDFPRIEINAFQLERVRNGSMIVIHSPIINTGQRVRLFDPEGRMVAVGEAKKPLGSLQTQVLPKVVLI
ncbi:MAG TPA: tRNA pseudouridine(55) synthase TruB [Acidobacteriota bacterium]|nr:tRNA pseudouridine(55) synthase TruB [Acidobacteriota bacterium]